MDARAGPCEHFVGPIQIGRLLQQIWATALTYSTPAPIRREDNCLPCRLTSLFVDRGLSCLLFDPGRARRLPRNSPRRCEQRPKPTDRGAQSCGRRRICGCTRVRASEKALTCQLFFLVSLPLPRGLFSAEPPRGLFIGTGDLSPSPPIRPAKSIYVLPSGGEDEDMLAPIPAASPSLTTPVPMSSTSDLQKKQKALRSQT